MEKNLKKNAQLNHFAVHLKVTHLNQLYGNEQNIF